ncbi:MAG: Nif3-like dinuclear metal center hexameric protein [Oscillospiraceae bacterium]
MKVWQIVETIDDFAPFDTQLDYDNSGLLVGNPETEVTKAIIALDLTLAVLNEAIAIGAELVITHHPIIFNPIKKVLADSIVYKAIQHNISVICAHTNLDVSPVGVSEYLARMIGLEQIVPLEIQSSDEDNLYAMGRIGILPEPLGADEFAHRVDDLLSCSGIRYTVGANEIYRVAVCGGSGGSLLPLVLQSDVQAYVTGDIKHDVFLAAAEAGLTLIDAGHFETETVVLPPLCQLLEKEIPTVTFITAKSNIGIVRTVES